MAAEKFEQEWKPEGGWTVRRPTTLLEDDSPPRDGQKLTFVGNGDGGTDSRLQLDGEDWVARCTYNEDEDTLTYHLDGVRFEVKHNTSARPHTLEATPPLPLGAVDTLGGWTADDGSAGGSGGEGDASEDSAKRRRHHSVHAP